MARGETWRIGNSNAFELRRSNRVKLARNASIGDVVYDPPEQEFVPSSPLPRAWRPADGSALLRELRVDLAKRGLTLRYEGAYHWTVITLTNTTITTDDEGPRAA